MGATQRSTVLVRAALIAGLAATTGTAMAQNSVSMAPPVANAVSIGTYSPLQNGTNTSADTVFNFTDIPANEKVPLVRAVFDQGGYQLYDKAGETIVVPFTNQNLYVMKFAVSSDDTMYFVNEDGTPVLYVPRNGYLENASVPGSKWYPFSNDFRPTTPVFLGAAPSYTEFINTGWYPNSYLYGGYYSPTPYYAGAIFQPTFGLSFVIGGNRYLGWNNYHSYLFAHPAPYRISFFNRPIYTVINHPRVGRPAFQGSFNRPRPGEVRRPSFAGVNPRFNAGSGYVRNNNDPNSNVYHRPGGTYHFTGNPGGEFSDPRRVPSVNLGQNPNRPVGPNFNGTTGVRPNFQGGTGSYTRPNFNGGSGSFMRPNFNSGLFPGGRPNFQGGGGNFNRPSFGGDSNNRPSFGGGFQSNRPSGGGNFQNNRPNSVNNPANRPLMSKPSPGGTMGFMRNQGSRGHR